MKRTLLAAMSALLIALASAHSLTAGPQGFAVHDAPREIPQLVFADGNGREASLAEFGGRTILLNVWATWCPPCVEEMPTLDALQAELGGDGFEVVALSIDSAGPEVVRKFYERTGLAFLKLYIDESTRAAATLGAFGLPVTLLIDPEGRELGRLVGPAEWDDPEMVAFLREFIAADADNAAAAPTRTLWKARTP